jgi:hypothetical protein
MCQFLYPLAQVVASAASVSRMAVAGAPIIAESGFSLLQATGEGVK